MTSEFELSERAAQIARVLRPLGRSAMSMEQAQSAGRLLGMHWTTVYRLRKRFLEDPVATSVSAKAPGPEFGDKRLDPEVEEVIRDTLTRWLPRQRDLAHPQLDLTLRIRARCTRAGLTPPSRSTVARRWAQHRQAEAAQLANAPGTQILPGHLVAEEPLELIQIDHTQSDLVVVDEHWRQPIGRPWITVAIDIATRCVVGVYIAMERPSAATVALLLTRVALPKAAWLASIGVETNWPMHGLPKALHLDNAAEFRSRALRTGCAQYGIELVYRPVGRPHFGGHVERLNRTLMERLRGLPGATGGSTDGRKERRSEERAALTLAEYERWMVLEIAQRYHHSPHRGLQDATPAGVWQALTSTSQPRQLSADPEQALRFVVQFLPIKLRTIQRDGLTVFHIRFWHPVFAAWRETRKEVIVRYHPEDLSRVFVTTDKKTYFEARCADLRRPRISLWEQRHALKLMKTQGQRNASEALIFKTIEQQRQLVARAKADTRASRRAGPKPAKLLPADPSAFGRPAEGDATVDYSKPAEPYDVEIW
ncbi:Mu transposase C-terminal domain-containing protein [Variovorax sp. J31P207]|uniref:Mu transposase C-terminal domain-containing protein n=1 Tax=Variovorax sp. J31P207 TaxID=3053510 RepID=UPI00257612B0|nr:Mu transposase C-terminal domain-containing protein [Variovorax sp. J31P207]MDM0071449.1 DDE-type integrase/transposase/recombinase [Variovorax sp. J31P207]